MDYLKSLLTLEIIKKLLYDKTVKRVVSFAIAITILPLMIYILQLDKEPEWIHTDKKELKESILFVSKSDDTTKLHTKIREEIYLQTLQNIKNHYDWDMMRPSLKSKILKNLKKIVSNIDLSDKISQKDEYKSDIIYKLYSIPKLNIELIIQDIHPIINDIVLKEENEHR
jgi:hypothetical protein